MPIRNAESWIADLIARLDESRYSASSPNCPIRFSFLAAILISFIAATSAAELDDTAPPPRFPAGAHLIVKSRLELDGVMTATDQDRSAKIPIKIKNNSVTITAIAAERDGRPTEVVNDYVADYSSIETSVPTEDGTSENATSIDTGALEGQVARYAMKDGVWSGRFTSEIEATPELRRALEAFVPPHEDSLLDGRRRSPGDKWVVDGRYLRRFAPDALTLKGRIECEYVNTVRREDRSAALIEWNLELETTSVDEEGEELRTKLGGSGRTWIDLTTGIEERSDGQGKLVQTGRVPNFPGPVRLAGNFVIRIENKFLHPGAIAPQR